MRRLEYAVAVEQQEDQFLIATTIALMALIFFIDLSIPLGVAGAVPYVAAVLLSLRSPQKQFTWYVALGASVLTGLGFLLSPRGGELWMIVANRLIALFAIWVTALLSLHHKRVEENLRDEKDTIELLYETSVAAAETPAAENLVGTALDRVCAFTGWPLGHAFHTNRDGGLASTDFWHCDDFSKFEVCLRIAERIVAQPQAGMFGRILNDREPAWMTDLANDPSLWKVTGVSETGLRGCFGFPILARGEIAYVLVFFSPDPIVPDQRLLENINYVASQTGSAIEHKLALEDLYRHGEAIEQSLDGIAIMDLDGQLQFVNTAFATMHGYTVEELRGGEKRLLHTQSQLIEDVWPFVERVKACGGAFDDVGRCKRDGTIFPTRTSASLLRDDEGEPVGILEIVRDVSETNELEAQLRHAQKMESIGRLAGGVAHDFNTILGAIIGNCELLEESLANNPNLYMSLEQIHKSAERGAALTRKLLTFSRDQEVELKVLSLNALIEDLEPMLRRIITEDIELHCELAPDLGRVKADPSLLEQVIMNLAVNASDAMPEGGVLHLATANCVLTEQRVDRLAELSPGRYVSLCVRDTGHGMEEHLQQRIFEPFYSTKAVGKGTGLGLSIVYGIVKQSGGGIIVNSYPGQGASFWIYLPEVAEEAVELVDAVLPAEVSTDGWERVLVVEDDDLLRNVLQRVLQRLGYEVHSAGSAQEALEVANSLPGELHLLITDVLMPGMNGMELAEAMAKPYPSAKVLFMSGYTEETLSDRAAGFRGSNFLAKPFGSESFAQKVRAVLDAEG